VDRKIALWKEAQHYCGDLKGLDLHGRGSTNRSKTFLQLVAYRSTVTSVDFFQGIYMLELS
jgi:hypothetical protein